MSLRTILLKDHWREQQVFTGRLLLAGIITFVLTLFLVARLFFLQVVNYDYFQELSHGNRVRIEAVPPTRGLIFDRNGVLLAENLPAYQLELIPEQVGDPEETVRALVAQGLLKNDDFAAIMQQIAKRRHFDPVAVRYRLSDEEVARFAVQRPHFPGVDIRARLARHYPVGPLAVHAVGYVGAIDQSDLRRIDGKSYSGTTHIGKIGVERAFEDRLHGKVGHQQVVVNAQGRSLQTIEGIHPSPGNDVFLTLDTRLQKAAELALDGHRGAAVAIDPRDGGILALASAPAYDPNLFGEGFTRRQFNELSSDSDEPLFNRALGGHYSPGSTIKPILALAALHYSIRNQYDELLCPGYYTLPGDDHRYRDWKKEGHGEVNLISAIEQSCDVYFYDLAIELGIDRIHQFMSLFGFGNATGIDILGEKPGLMPSRDWKRRSFSERAEQVWFPGETVISGIGQGFMLATPLQLAHATSILAARGKRFQPRLISAIRDPMTSELVMNPPVELEPVPVTNPEYWKTIIDGMVDVVHGEHGTAIGAGLGLDYRMAGKTGTVQIFSIGQEDEYDAEEVQERLRHHAMFIAFAPLEQPELAVAVIIENAGSGAAAAAPAARAIFDAWFAGRDEAVIATSNTSQSQ
ncbi:MAG: penicillin-binding protein 2 [Gammaproteobacteria bacterium]|nr:penicillin-binding protein 2 [Gammaproteobacteria bacterium]